MISHMRSIKKYTYFTTQIKDERFNDVLLSNNLTIGYHAKYTVGDGNCFFRSVSYLLFATENCYDIIKLCCIFIILDYESFFKNILKEYCYNFNYETLLRNLCRKDEWASEIIFIATSILLNRPILSFTCDEKSKKPFVINYSFEHNDVSPILIGYYKHHFVPLLRDNKLIKNLNTSKHHSVLYGKELHIVSYN